MFTPTMLEPIIGQEPLLTQGELSVHSNNAGEFEAVLDDLLDTTTEQSEFALLLFPLPLHSSTALWAMDGQNLLAPVTVDSPRGSASWRQILSVQGVSEELAIPPLLATDGGVRLVASPANGSPAPFLADGQEVANTDAQAQGLGGLEQEPVLTVESKQQAEPFILLQEQENPPVLVSDFDQSILEPQRPTPDAAASTNGDEGVSPVSSARQGETLSSPLLTERETAEPTSRGLERADEPHRTLQRQDESRDHASRMSVLHHTPAAHRATQTEPSHSVQSAQPDWNAVDQVAQHIERMVYNRERDSITVRLDPPELGVIELRIQATGGEVQAWVNAERDLTRQLLQQTQQQLREQLETRGLQLTHFDVGGQSNPHFAQARSFRTPATTITTTTHPSTATDSLNDYDGRWSVWV